MKEIRVFLVDDHQLFRNGLTLLMENEKNITIVGEAENGRQFLDTITGDQPDVVLMDIEMPVMDGFQATREACALYPDLKIITLTLKYLKLKLQ